MGAVENTVFLHPIVKQVIGEALEELILALKKEVWKKGKKRWIPWGIAGMSLLNF